MVHTMLSKSSVSDLTIFSTTRLASIGSPFLSSWLATFSTQVMYLVTYFLSSIFNPSNSPLRAWSWTCLTRSFALYATSRISHASFEDATFAIFLKHDSSTTLYKKYKVDLSLTRVFFSAVIWAVVWFASFAGSSYSVSTISHKYLGIPEESSVRKWLLK